MARPIMISPTGDGGTSSVESPAGVSLIRRKLLAWYRRQQRKLPWRRAKPDPYLTFVSEVMLQQTQVVTVIPYFKRFVERFPTLRSLARAKIDEVLPYWSGLGYYRRCHQLHAAAVYLTDHLKGRWPQSVDALAELPGIGRYTAGAVASIAFGQRAAAVDGNVRRVLVRVCGIRARGNESELSRRIWSIAERWVPMKNPGDFNQALMELGATVCRPRSPCCTVCPLRSICRYARGDIPAPQPTRRTPRVRPMAMIALAIRRGDQFWFRRRPNQGLWAGLWEWPSTEREADESREQAAARLRQELGLAARSSGSWSPPVEFLLTHRRITFEVLNLEIGHKTKWVRSGNWITLRDVKHLAVSNAQRRLLQSLRSMATSGE